MRMMHIESVWGKLAALVLGAGLVFGYIAFLLIWMIVTLVEAGGC